MILSYGPLLMVLNNRDYNIDQNNRDYDFVIIAQPYDKAKESFCYTVFFMMYF